MSTYQYPDAAIAFDSVHKRFGTTLALQGLSFSVPRGTVGALLGRNGAGKSTTVRILTTMVRPDLGKAYVDGFDVVRDPGSVRLRIGVAGQNATLDDHLSAKANLLLVGRLSRLGWKDTRANCEFLLEAFKLSEYGRRQVRTYSGGMRRRLDLAASLIARPSVLFLDEPTNGLDPGVRLAVWESIRELANSGTTILLTTQMLEEAEQIADRISVINNGVIVVDGTANDLKNAVGLDRVRLSFRSKAERESAGRFLLGSGTTPIAVFSELTLEIPTASGHRDACFFVRCLSGAGLDVDEVECVRPTLDAVFVRYTTPVDTTPLPLAGPTRALPLESTMIG
jgi:ABC-2 type transport system ATP-binding protein